jgi:hypothetical protein
VRQEFLMFAEGAEAVNGKIYILGGGVDIHNGQSFPTALKVDIALGILIGWAETNQQIDLQVRIVNEDEVESFTVGAQMTVGRPPQAMPGQDIRSLVAIRGPFPMAQPGAYKATMFLNGAPQEPPFRFWVNQIPMPVDAR